MDGTARSEARVMMIIDRDAYNELLWAGERMRAILNTVAEMKTSSHHLRNACIGASRTWEHKVKAVRPV